MKRRLGDRSDGYKLRKVDPLFRLIPHIMKERSDAQVFFEDSVYLDKTNATIKALRKEGLKVGFLHVVIAAMVRTISQKPHINRFVVGKKTYARNNISFSLAVKKEMSEEGEETVIKFHFEPEDTLYDVVEKMNATIEENKKVEEKNNMDIFVKAMNLLPNFLLGMAMSLIRFMDNHGLLPKFVIALSPFHSSVFVTDLGSIGIKPVYHHIYNLGTNTVFIAFGTRSKEQVIEDNLEISKRRRMDLKIVADERVCDGYYFAQSLKLAKRYMTNPELLLSPPEEVFKDLHI
jgi:hypothetical protein